MSISKLICDKNCQVNIFSSQCEFQDLNLGKTIGNPGQGGGIYFFEDGSNVKGQPESTCFKSISSISDNEILLWHFRLGHLSFWYSKYLFSKLFINKNLSSFQCEIYELAKHHHVSCPS